MRQRQFALTQYITRYTLTSALYTSAA